jgi:hypothetical protein
MAFQTRPFPKGVHSPNINHGIFALEGKRLSCVYPPGSNSINSPSFLNSTGYPVTHKNTRAV